MGFSRQEYWSGLPCPSPGDLPNPGIEPLSLMSLVLGGRFFTASATGEAHKDGKLYVMYILSQFKSHQEFPGGSVVRTWSFHCWGPGSISGQGSKTPHGIQPGQKICLKTKEAERDFKILEALIGDNFKIISN